MAKIRSFTINSSIPPPDILLHNSRWEVTAISPCTDAFSAKYLGFLANHVNDDEAAFSAVEQYLQKSTSILIHSNIPKEVKLLVYRMQIVPKVLYVATKACWSIKQYRSLDKYPSQLLKHVGGHMPPSPTMPCSISPLINVDLDYILLVTLHNLKNGASWHVPLMLPMMLLLLRIVC